MAGLGWRYQETLPDHGERDGERFDCDVWAVVPEDFRRAAGDLIA